MKKQDGKEAFGANECSNSDEMDEIRNTIWRSYCTCPKLDLKSNIFALLSLVDG